MYREDARTPKADFALAKLLTVRFAGVWCVTARKRAAAEGCFPKGNH
jgi:hypothetical protein